MTKVNKRKNKTPKQKLTNVITSIEFKIETKTISCEKCDNDDQDNIK